MNLTVVVKTFRRPGACVAVVRSWLAVAPDIPIIVVDDGGDVSPDLSGFPTVNHIRTEFDIGLSAGRNVGVAAASTRYVLIADDDNGCTRDSDLAGAVAQLQAERVGILGVGAYRFVESDGMLWLPGVPRVTEFTRCDGVLNHFVGDREAMPQWDAAIKLAGEHVDYFLECRKRGVAVAATPLLAFYRTRHAVRTTTAPDYARFRRRSFRRAVRAKWGYRAISPWGRSPVAAT
jgi:hypothetical protein